MDEVRSVQTALIEEGKRRSDLTRALSQKDQEMHRLFAQVDILQAENEQIMSRSNTADRIAPSDQRDSRWLEQPSRATDRDRVVADREPQHDRDMIRELQEEIEAYRAQVKQLTNRTPAASVASSTSVLAVTSAVTPSSASSDNERSMLLAEVLKSRQQIDQLTQKLKAVQSHNKARGTSLETLNALEDQLMQVEHERDHERRQHEHQIRKILKATGGYDKAYYDRLLGGENDENNDRSSREGPLVDLSDEIVDLFRQSQDEERLKVGTALHGTDHISTRTLEKLF